MELLKTDGVSKVFGGLKAVSNFDIEINETDPKKIVEICKAISITFGGINLEDIKAPKCFEIEKELRNQRIEVAFPQLDIHIKDMPPRMKSAPPRIP